MTKGLPTIVLADELKILDLALENEGTVSHEELKAHNVELEVSQSVEKGYLRVNNDSPKFPSYEITNDGVRYLSLAGTKLNELREKI